MEVVNASIKHQEELRDTAKKDRDAAKKELEEEEDRWNKTVTTYEDFMGELKAELKAVDQVLELFSTANIKDDMLEKIDW